MDKTDIEKAAVIRARLEKYLVDKSFYFNPDPDMVDSILIAMAKRREKFGEDYCPCRRVTGDKQEDAKIICPCVYHQDELAAQGYCHCRLFTSF